MMSWEETRGRFEELELEHERASSESEAAAIIEKVIALAESFMASSADEWRFSHVYGVIAAWLAKSDRLWEWVKHRCVIAASDNERIALNVSILELFAEGVNLIDDRP